MASLHCRFYSIMLFSKYRAKENAFELRIHFLHTSSIAIQVRHRWKLCMQYISSSIRLRKSRKYSALLLSVCLVPTQPPKHFNCKIVYINLLRDFRCSKRKYTVQDRNSIRNIKIISTNTCTCYIGLCSKSLGSHRWIFSSVCINVIQSLGLI